MKIAVAVLFVVLLALPAQAKTSNPCCSSEGKADSKPAVIFPETEAAKGVREKCSELTAHEKEIGRREVELQFQERLLERLTREQQSIFLRWYDALHDLVMGVDRAPSFDLAYGSVFCQAMMRWQNIEY